MGKRHSLTINNRGVAFLELAIMLPVLVLLVAGIIDFGRSLRLMELISEAARHGAREGVAYRSSTTGNVPRCGDVQQYARARAEDYLNDSGIKEVGHHASSNDTVEWKVVPVFNSESAGNSGQRGYVNKVDLLTVTVEQVGEGRACYLCWDAILRLPRIRASSTFRLETECQNS